MSLRRTFNNTYRNLQESLVELDKIKMRTEYLRRKAIIFQNAGIGLGLAGLIGDSLANKSLTFSWMTAVGSFTGLSIYLLSKNILNENNKKECKKLDRIIEGFDEDFAGFREIAQFLMHVFLKDASSSERDVFKNYILNIHFAHEKLMEIRTNMKSTRESALSETTENFNVLKLNFGNLYNSYMGNFDS